MSDWFIVEGQTEKVFVETFFVGRVLICNLWQMDINKFIRTMPKASRVFVVCDTDCTEIHELQRFRENMTTLVATSANVFLLQQNKNFEQELVRSCAQLRTKEQLVQHFSCAGTKEFKNQFLKTKKLREKLEQVGFNLEQ